MSRENVEIVRRASEAYARRDLDAALANSHPEVTSNPFEEAPCRGLAAVRAYLARWESAWDAYEIEAEAYIDAGESVLVTMHFRGRGKASGIETEARSYQVYRLRDGKTVSMVEYLERRQALEAAGLSE
jgi:ketosteroid isomerase-like protein